MLKKMLPEELRVDLVRLEKRTYEDIHNYVTSQIPQRKEEEMRKRGKTMPLNALDGAEGNGD